MVEGVVARGFAGEAAHCWACGWRGAGEGEGGW